MLELSSSVELSSSGGDTYTVPGRLAGISRTYRRIADQPVCRVQAVLKYLVIFFSRHSTCTKHTLGTGVTPPTANHAYAGASYKARAIILFARTLESSEIIRA